MQGAYHDRSVILSEAGCQMQSGNVWGKTDPGRRRTNNEDAWIADASLGFAAVADGMGGAAFGEVASAIALQVLYSNVSMVGPDGPPGVLVDGAHAANASVRSETVFSPECARDGIHARGGVVAEADPARRQRWRQPLLPVPQEHAPPAVLRPEPRQRDARRDGVDRRARGEVPAAQRTDLGHRGDSGYCRAGNVPSGCCRAT